jgi:hypothetical protein
MQSSLSQVARKVRGINYSKWQASVVRGTVKFLLYCNKVRKKSDTFLAGAKKYHSVSSFSTVDHYSLSYKRRRKDILVRSHLAY